MSFQEVSPQTMSQSAPSAIDYSQSASDSSNIAQPVDVYYNYTHSHESDAPGLNLQQSIPAAVQTNIEILNPFNQTGSRAAQEWHLRKLQGENSSTLEELMQYQGLEAAKRPFLDLKSMMEIWKKRDPARSMDSLKLEGFKGIFHGNPGTGKTAVARINANSDHSSNKFNQRSQENPQQVVAQQQTSTTVCTGKRKGVWDIDRGVDNGSAKRHQGLASYKPSSHLKYFTSKESNTPPKVDIQQQLSTQNNVSREDGISDTVWENVCNANKHRTIKQKLLETQIGGLERQIKSDEDKEDSEYISTLQDRLKQARSKMEKEEKIQNALQAMGRCVIGYSWTRQEGGYRCEGGAHFVSDEELATEL